MASLDKNAVLRSDSLQVQLDRREGQKKALAADLEAAPAPEPRFHANLAELYRQKVERLHESQTGTKIRQEAMEILRGLIETIILRPASEGLEIELIGEIEKMLELPGVPGSSVPAMYRSSVKLVAGESCQQHRTLTAFDLAAF